MADLLTDLDGEDVNNERAALEAVERERLHHHLQRDNGRAEYDNLWMVFSKVIGICKELNA